MRLAYIINNLLYYLFIQLYLFHRHLLTAFIYISIISSNFNSHNTFRRLI